MKRSNSANYAEGKEIEQDTKRRESRNGLKLFWASPRFLWLIFFLRNLRNLCIYGTACQRLPMIGY